MTGNMTVVGTGVCMCALLGGGSPTTKYSPPGAKAPAGGDSSYVPSFMASNKGSVCLFLFARWIVWGMMCSVEFCSSVSFMSFFKCANVNM